jgi:hypothetical protein
MSEQSVDMGVATPWPSLPKLARRPVEAGRAPGLPPAPRPSIFDLLGVAACAMLTVPGPAGEEWQ